MPTTEGAHLPLYTNFMGSTASAVATMSSALCLRPLTTMSPSILPTTNTRPPGPTKPSRPVLTKGYSLTGAPELVTGNTWGQRALSAQQGPASTLLLGAHWSCFPQAGSPHLTLAGEAQVRIAAVSASLRAPPLPPQLSQLVPPAHAQGPLKRPATV